MPTGPVKSADRQEGRGRRDGVVGRRAFLRRSLGAGAALLAGSASALADGVRADGGDSDSARAQRFSGPEKSRVVHIVDQRLLPVRIVQRSLLKDHLAQGLLALTGASAVDEAWHRILRPDDVVLLKFNQSGARQLGTAPPVAAELVESLVSAGWNPQRLVLLEAGDDLPPLPRTREPDLRWQGVRVQFGRSGSDSFLAALEEATAIINVPFLKTHHLAVMTACLKNLSHGLIRHPARFHGNGCDPAIGEIAASPPIREKLRLNVVNALRVPFDLGPEAGEPEIATAGALLLGRDPVACDAVGFSILNEIRALREMRPLLPGSRVPPQLATAARLGAGRFDAEFIEVQRLPA